MTRNLALHNGWRHQAAHLAVTHTAFGMAAVTVADKARRRPKQITRHPGILGSELEEDGFETNQIDVAAEHELTRTRLVELERQVARKTAAARIQNGHIKSLAAKVATADERIAELEDELDSAREERAHQENENRSLQTSLDLRLSESTAANQRTAELEAELDSAREERAHQENENWSLQTSLDLRVSESTAANQRIAELEAELGATRERLAHWENENRSLQASLDLSFGENSRLAQRLRESNAAVDKASSQLAQLTSTLNTNLTVTTKRAVGAEKMLAEVRHGLLGNVELLQNSLQGKELKIREFEQRHTKLLEGSRTLLKTLKARETALARAEQRIKSLAEQIAELKAEASLAKNQERVDELNFQLQCQRTEWLAAHDAHDKAVTTCMSLDHELNFYGKQSSQSLNQPEARFTEALLAGTITL